MQLARASTIARASFLRSNRLQSANRFQVNRGGHGHKNEQDPGESFPLPTTMTGSSAFVSSGVMWLGVAVAAGIPCFAVWYGTRRAKDE